ncbi:hypothetical protein FXO37_33610 [Capsicum annuum]|nr:hypothetical protein FXO37_33610 [Capsicum annuum]
MILYSVFRVPCSMFITNLCAFLCFIIPAFLLYSVLYSLWVPYLCYVICCCAVLCVCVISRDLSRGSFGNSLSTSSEVEAAELDWGNETHIKAVGPPFDFIIGTDVFVYTNNDLSLLGLCGASLGTTFADNNRTVWTEDNNFGALGYEIRSTNVHEKMLEMWKRNFEVKTVPKAKMDSTYQHPSIQLYIMNSKPQGSTSEIVTPMAQQQNDEVTETETNHGSDEDESKHGFNQDDVTDNEGKVDNSLVMDLENRKLSDWEARRCGAMAARLLRDVKIT